MVKKTATKLTPRPPVIAIMGHIDHGKSTLLDFIRQSNIVAGEAGGITQHISAYEVVHETKTGEKKKITFLDTPGHEAFSGVRSRGANIADIAVLIVSAEEGVKEQTIEAYKSIIETKTPFIVAINKIDRPNANLERTKQQLAEVGIFVEGYGGNIPFVPISAKAGTGVSELLDMMLLVAEMEELTGNPALSASGLVLEAKLDPQMGTSVTLIIKNGTLHTGDLVAVGNVSAKIKKMENFAGETIKEASFSSPVSVFGFSAIPEIGSCFVSFDDKKMMEKYMAENNQENICQKIQATTNSTEGQISIPIVIKTDVYGSLEAVIKEVVKIHPEKVSLNIIQTGVGAITENDVKAASSSTKSIILGFHVKVDASARDQAEKYGVKIMTFDIIYKLSEWLAEEVTARTPKEQIETIVGRAKILKIFNNNQKKQIVGGQVVSGTLTRGNEVKVMRREAEICHGKITDLQEQKIKTNQVTEGTQFGAEIDAKLDLSAGDYLEAIETSLK